MFKLDDDMSINWKMFTRNVENAQKKVEGFNYSARKNIIEYDNVLNQQRAEVYAEREKVLNGEDIHENIVSMIRDLAAETVGDFDYEDAEQVDIEDFNKALEQFLLDPGTNFITLDVLNKYSHRELVDLVADRAVNKYETKYAQNTQNGFNIAQLERDVFLRNLDRRWVEHIDDMDNLKMGIGLRGYANKNPVIVYQAEGGDMFEEMIMSVRKEVAKFMLALPILTVDRQRKIVIPGQAKPNTNLQTHTNGKPSKPKTVVNKQTVGRNDPCPCGSGKKYKNCCGR